MIISYATFIPDCCRNINIGVVIVRPERQTKIDADFTKLITDVWHLFHVSGIDEVVLAPILSNKINFKTAYDAIR